MGNNVTMRTYALTNDQWARPACPLVSSSKTSRVQLRYPVRAFLRTVIWPE